MVLYLGIFPARGLAVACSWQRREDDADAVYYASFSNARTVDLVKVARVSDQLKGPSLQSRSDKARCKLEGFPPDGLRLDMAITAHRLG